LKLFLEAMPAMAATAESIAKAVGAPFLRSDFSVGSEKWGVRLNEVAYGSGADCRKKVEGVDEGVDDGPVIARILQEGFKHCKSQPAEHFMVPLGVEGEVYDSMSVRKVSSVADESQERRRPRLPSFAQRAFQAASIGTTMFSPVAAKDCDTPWGTQQLQVGTTTSQVPVVSIAHPQQFAPTAAMQATPRIVKSGSLLVPPPATLKK